jgi:hypothetical protein
MMWGSNFSHWEVAMLTMKREHLSWSLGQSWLQPPHTTGQDFLTFDRLSWATLSGPFGARRENNQVQSSLCYGGCHVTPAYAVKSGSSDVPLVMRHLLLRNHRIESDLHHLSLSLSLSLIVCVSVCVCVCVSLPLSNFLGRPHRSL